MTASESSFVGIAKQTAKGTPNVTDADFDYLLYREAAVGVMPSFLPLDMEVGGGAMLRNILKVGLMTGGRMSIIPRPRTLGNHFLGVTGAVNSVDNSDGSFTHSFTISDQFAAPWWTVRNSPGGLLSEQLPDTRYAGLTLGWKGGRFVEGEMALQGIGNPLQINPATWGAMAKVDGGPQFIAPLGTIELPTGTNALVTAGAFTAGISMPVEEQIVVGSYTPNNLSITQRAYVLSLALKIDDAVLYKKVMYDGDGGTAWVARMFREASFKLNFKSEAEAAEGVPYQFGIAANGLSGDDANVSWSCQPLGTRAGRQIILGLTGTFLASSNGASPLTLSLTNKKATY